MAMTDFIAAVDLSSTKISGIAGKKNEQGELSILSYIKEDASSFMKKGVVYNLAKATQAIQSVISQMEDELESKIAKVYVGIAGQSLHSVKTTINRDLEEDTVISKEIVDSMLEENNKVPVLEKNTLLLDTIVLEYKLGNDYQLDPVGVPRNHIEGNYLNIIARDTLIKNIELCFEKIDVEIADFIVTPIASSNILISEADKRSGCAYIDFGAETTTIAIYHANLLRYITVLPLGGNSITKDITSLKIEMDEAEAIKLEYGNLNYEDKSKDIRETFYVGSNKERELPISHVNNLIRARVEEIVQNAWNLIQQSGFHDCLVAGITITGGASNLPGLEDMIKQITRINKVKQGQSHIKFQQSNVISARFRKEDPNTYYGIQSLLSEGKVNCCKIEKPVTPDIFESEEHINKQETNPGHKDEPGAPTTPLTKEEQQKLEELEAIEQERLEKIKKRDAEEKKRRELERLKREQEEKARKEELEKKRLAEERARHKKGGFIRKFTDGLDKLQKGLFDNTPTDDDSDNNTNN